MKLVSTLMVTVSIPGSFLTQEKRRTDSLVFEKLYSKVLGEERRLAVHLPLNYLKEAFKKSPVMYVPDASRLDFDIIITSHHLPIISRIPCFRLKSAG